jgi:hypothetical protein
MASTSVSPAQTAAKGKQHGGSRQRLCWEQKLQLLDEDVIKNFISAAKCGNKCNCFEKIRGLKEQALETIRDMRSARLQGDTPTNLVNLADILSTAKTTIFIL